MTSKPTDYQRDQLLTYLRRLYAQADTYGLQICDGYWFLYASNDEPLKFGPGYQFRIYPGHVEAQGFGKGSKEAKARACAELLSISQLETPGFLERLKKKVKIFWPSR